MDKFDMELAEQESEDMAAEIERLRTVLASLLEDPPYTLDEPDTDAEVIQKMRSIVRDALAQ
jgi:hypothetical protein